LLQSFVVHRKRKTGISTESDQNPGGDFRRSVVDPGGGGENRLVAARDFLAGKVGAGASESWTAARWALIRDQQIGWLREWASDCRMWFQPKSGMKEQNPYSPGDFCEVQGPVARRCGCSINLMRYFSLFVALLALLAGIGSVSVISKISQICLKTGGVADFPVLTQWMFRSSGWIPGGLFLAVAVAIICLVFARRVRTSFFLSVAALIFLVCSAVILPECLMDVMSRMTREVVR
jgi:hypothetical protein